MDLAPDGHLLLDVGALQDLAELLERDEGVLKHDMARELPELNAPRKDWTEEAAQR